MPSQSPDRPPSLRPAERILGRCRPGTGDSSNMERSHINACGLYWCALLRTGYIQLGRDE
jgi:hypothetical protein